MGNKFDSTLDCSPILKADLFSSLLDADREIVISRSGFIQLRNKGVLFRPGETARHFYLLLEGGIRVFKTDSNDKENEVARFAPGDIIGDFDFARGADYDACAQAEGDSVLIMFPAFGLTMEQFALDSSHTVSKILLSSIEMMTNRIKSTRKILMENMSWIQELHRKAYEDPGTGLWKQTFITDEISRILEEPTALIMLKPDRFKILVDSRGHDAGDEAMIHIALVLKNITRRLGRGWPLRFKSNETGILVNKCSAEEAESLAKTLYESIAALPPVPGHSDIPPFSFTGTVVWAVWPLDNRAWDALLQSSSSLLLDTWRVGGNRIVHNNAGASS